MAALPQFHTEHVAPDSLQVTIERREPPPPTPATPIPPAPVLPHEPLVKKKAPPQKQPTPRETEKPVAPAPERTPVIALPQASSVAEPAFTAPAREERSPPSPSEPVTARAAPAAEPAFAPKVTPPRSDAAYLHNPQPHYPISARRRGEQGTVLLKVLVTPEGLAGSVSVQGSSGSTALDQAALEAVRNWRFVPARQGTQPIEGWHLVPIVFRLEGVS